MTRAARVPRSARMASAYSSSRHSRREQGRQGRGRLECQRNAHSMLHASTHASMPCVANYQCHAQLRDSSSADFERRMHHSNLHISGTATVRASELVSVVLAAATAMAKSATHEFDQLVRRLFAYYTHRAAVHRCIDLGQGKRLHHHATLMQSSPSIVCAVHRSLFGATRERCCSVEMKSCICCTGKVAITTAADGRRQLLTAAPRGLDPSSPTRQQLLEAVNSCW